MLSLTADITYRRVEGWCSVTYRDLKMSVIHPHMSFPKTAHQYRKLPTVIWLCGGGFFSMDHNVWLPQMTTLAERGFVVVAPEYRTFGEADSYPGALTDVKAAIRYMRAHAEEFDVDPDRIYTMGDSAGGCLALLCSVTNGDKTLDEGEYLEYSSDVQAVVSFYGPTDLSVNLDCIDTKKRFADTRSDRQMLGVYSFSSLAEGKDPLSLADKKTPPTLIFHGIKDATVSVEQSIAYYERLQELGVRSDLYLLEDGTHDEDFFFRDEIYGLIEKFFRQD